MSKVSTFIGVIILIFTILCSNVFAGPTFVDEYDVTTDETTPTGIIFNPEGTRMYVTGIDKDRIRQYTLSVAFDVTSTITLERSRDISSVEKEEIINFLVTLDDDDDVQNVYTNAKL